MKVKIAQDTTDATIQTDTPATTPTTLMYQRSVEEVVTRRPPLPRRRISVQQRPLLTENYTATSTVTATSITGPMAMSSQTHNSQNMNGYGTGSGTTEVTANVTTGDDNKSSLALAAETTTTASAEAEAEAITSTSQGAVDRKQLIGGDRHSYSALPCKLKVHIKIAPDSKTKNISSSSCNNDISDNTKLTITTVSNTQVSNADEAVVNLHDDDDDVDEEDEVVVAEIVEEIVETPTAAQQNTAMTTSSTTNTATTAPTSNQ